MAYTELLKDYLNEKLLTKQYIDSYDKFVEEGIQQIISAQEKIEPEIKGLVLKLGKVSVEKPAITEADG